MNSMAVLTAIAIVLGLVGIAWSLVLATFVGFCAIEPSTGATYLGNRMGTLLFALAVTAWLGRKAANSEARRALMNGAFIVADYSAAYAKGWGDFATAFVEKIPGHAPRRVRDCASDMFSHAMSGGTL